MRKIRFSQSHHHISGKLDHFSSETKQTTKQIGKTNFLRILLYELTNHYYCGIFNSFYSRILFEMLGRIGILCFSAGFLFGFSFIALATQIGDKFVAQGKRIWLECMKMELKIVFWTNKRPNGMEKISHKNEPYHEIRPPSDEIWKMYKHYALMRMQLWTEELAWMHIRFWSEAECRWCMATIEMLWRKYDVTHKLRIFWEMRGCWMPENVCVCVCVCVP